jgi:uncharacterized damage-inducible protein DinB
MVTIDELLEELEQETRHTRNVLSRVPADRMHWKPHEKSLTLGQLAMHVATIPGALAEISTRPFDVNTPIPRPGASSTAELLETMERSVAGAKRVLTEMGDVGLLAPWQLVSGGHEIMALPRVAFLRSTLFNHWYHHRGQLTVYLRELGANVPAMYGDSADEKMLPA